MARIAALMELRPTDRRRPQDARYDQGCDTSPKGDVLMEQILEDLNTTPPEEVLKRITSLPPQPTRQSAGHPSPNCGRDLPSSGSAGYCDRSGTGSDHCLVTAVFLLRAP